MKGRATVGGFEYLREGEPSDSFNRFAAAAIEIGKIAIEAAAREPEGWVVVSAAKRPWCRVRNGLSEYEYRRRGLPFFFKDQREGARFAERINARPKGDPNQEAGSLSVRDFAREAQEHADIWRRAGR
ncbi:hypothetical protein [Bradyrhizobium sp.]|uniref:hypothetical protein n=1 Tax=Bradyrhizobium sp. TaxID=376 RepID=UPI002721C08D|nr:hypothetical protein [Bradyrhizobium sp.]MDO9297970.1 hypothetical protein [Bradyrhizobium sp.]